MLDERQKVLERLAKEPNHDDMCHLQGEANALSRLTRILADLVKLKAA